MSSAGLGLANYRAVNNIGNVLLLLLLLLASTPAQVVSLRCVQCNSTEDARCLQGVGSITTCRGRSASCVTFVGLMPLPGPDVVTRGCSVSGLPDNFCMPVLASNHKHFLCISTCQTHYCNNRAIRRRKPPSAARPLTLTVNVLTLACVSDLGDLGVKMFYLLSLSPAC